MSTARLALEAAARDLLAAHQSASPAGLTVLGVSLDTCDDELEIVASAGGRHRLHLHHNGTAWGAELKTASARHLIRGTHLVAYSLDHATADEALTGLFATVDWRVEILGGAADESCPHEDCRGTIDPDGICSETCCPAKDVVAA